MKLTSGIEIFYQGEVKKERKQRASERARDKEIEAEIKFCLCYFLTPFTDIF